MGSGLCENWVAGHGSHAYPHEKNSGGFIKSKHDAATREVCVCVCVVIYGPVHKVVVCVVRVYIYFNLYNYLGTLFASVAQIARNDDKRGVGGKAREQAMPRGSPETRSVCPADRGERGVGGQGKGGISQELHNQFSDGRGQGEKFDLSCPDRGTVNPLRYRTVCRIFCTYIPYVCVLC